MATSTPSLFQEAWKIFDTWIYPLTIFFTVLNTAMISSDCTTQPQLAVLDVSGFYGPGAFLAWLTTIFGTVVMNEGKFILERFRNYARPKRAVAPLHGEVHRRDANLALETLGEDGQPNSTDIQLEGTHEDLSPANTEILHLDTSLFAAVCYTTIAAFDTVRQGSNIDRSSYQFNQYLAAYSFTRSTGLPLILLSEYVGDTSQVRSRLRLSTSRKAAWHLFWFTTMGVDVLHSFWHLIPLHGISHSTVLPSLGHYLFGFRMGLQSILDGPYHSYRTRVFSKLMKASVFVFQLWSLTEYSPWVPAPPVSGYESVCSSVFVPVLSIPMSRVNSSLRDLDQAAMLGTALLMTFVGLSMKVLNHTRERINAKGDATTGAQLRWHFQDIAA